MKVRRTAVERAVGLGLPRRACHRCGKRFRPRVTTQYHCSEECAVACVLARSR